MLNKIYQKKLAFMNKCKATMGISAIVAGIILLAGILTNSVILDIIATAPAMAAAAAFTCLMEERSEL